MKRYKPKIRLIGPLNFNDVDYLYKCSGLGYSAYGETPDVSYRAWKETLGLVDIPALIFVWINELIYKVKKYYDH